MASRVSLQSLKHINVICNAFEDQWRVDESLRIETVLQQAAGTDRSALLYELLLVELYYREGRRQSPSANEYRSRFPHDGETIALAFNRHFLSSATRSMPTPEPRDQQEGVRLCEGDRIGRYEVLRHLGGGSFANVYLARDPENDQLRAVKLQRRRSSPEQLGNLLAEARMLDGVACPAIVPVVDAGQHIDGQPYLVMEYVDGATLKTLLQHATLTRERAVNVIADLATMIGLVHREGLFHRDLKPANILVDKYDRPRVVDFGLAVHESTQRERAGEFAGSVAYMSPEQIRGQSHRLDGRADIWALGVILYEVLAGRRPFDGQNREQIEDEILYREPRPPRQIVGNEFSPQLEEICLKALSKKIARRFATAEDMADMLRSALEPSPPPESLRLPERTHFRRKVIWAAGLLLCLAALLGGAALFKAQQTRLKSEGAAVLVRSLRAANFQQVAPLVDDIAHSAKWSVPHLKRELAASGENEEQALRYRLALHKAEPDASHFAHGLGLLLNQDAERIFAWQDILLQNVSGASREQAIELLRSELDRRRLPVAERVGMWSRADIEHAESVERAGGVLMDEFAYVPVMPIAEFRGTAGALGASNYRPLRFRPFLKDGSVCVAAVWTRDNLEWRFADSLSEKELMLFDKQLAHEGFRAVDLAAYIDKDHEGRVAHCGIWARADEPRADTTLLVGVDATRHASEAARLAAAGFQQQTYSILSPSGGERLASSIWARSTDPSNSIEDEIQPDYFGDLDGLCDVAVYSTNTPPNTAKRFTRQLALAKKFLFRAPNNAAARFLAGRADHYLGNDELALANLAWVVEHAPSLRYYALPIRAQALAGSGRPAEAEECLLAYRHVLADRDAKRKWSDAYLACLEAQLAARGGDVAGGLERLELCIREQGDDQETLFYAACAYSAIASLVAEHASDQSKTYVARAVELLRRANLKDEFRLHVTVDLESLRDLPEFRELLHSKRPPLAYAAAWQEGGNCSVKTCYRLSPEEHRWKCSEFTRLGYHPVAISTLQPAPGERVVVTSVWQRRAHSAREQHLANVQANAAAALLRLDPTASVWQLLQHTDRPLLRPRVIEQLHAFRVDEASIEQKLFAASADVSVRRALLLSLGNYKSELGSPAAESLVARVRRLAEEDGDAGTHAAANWLLRTWGRQTAIRDGDLPPGREASTGRKPSPGSTVTWSVNGEGQTMVLLPGPVEFAMGSPTTEPDRKSDEALHVERIGHSLMISATEVTVGQMARIAKGESISNVRQRDLPAQVSWYEAAEYCNRLSEKEGILPDQWCYSPNENGEFAEGTRIAANYAERQGYRLPTEAEWEYACRANSKTSWAHGDTRELLGAYAWFYDNAAHTPSPVGMLKPNDFGLFDMSGNVMEWCHAPVRPGSVRTSNTTVIVTNASLLVARGGSHKLAAPHTRCSARVTFEPWKSQQIGFRVVRTILATP